MEIKLSAQMQACDNCGYVAWIEGSRNFDMVVQGATPEEATRELVTSLKVNISFLFGVDVESITDKKNGDDHELYAQIYKSFMQTGKREIKFQFE